MPVHVRDFLRMRLDELSPRLDFVAHQAGEDLVGDDRVASIVTCRIVRFSGFIVVSES